MSTDYVAELKRDASAFVGAMDQDVLIGRVVRGDASQSEYVTFLAATYHYVHFSGFLLAKTAEGLRRSQRCPFLLELVEAKAKEEAPHDSWALSDLRNCGANAELVRGGPVPRAVQAYLDFSQVLAEEGSPAFLGVAYTLEFISMQRARHAAENLRAHGKIANIERSLRFLRGHGDADQEHVARLAGLLSQVTDTRDQAEIRFSAALLRSLYPRFFRIDVDAAV